MDTPKILRDFVEVKVGMLTKEDVYVFFITFVYQYLASGWLSLINIPLLRTLGSSWVVFGGVLGWLLLFRHKNNHRTKIVAGRGIAIVSAYVLGRIALSWIQGIALMDIIGTLKYYYIQCVSLWLLLPYLSHLTYVRILVILKLLLWCVVIEFPFFILQFLGFDYLKTERMLEVDGIELYRSFSIMPQFPIFLPIALFFLLMKIGNIKKVAFFLFLCILCILLCLTRSSLANLLVVISVVVMVVMFKTRHHHLIETALIGLLAVGLIAVIHPNLFRFWMGYISQTSEEVEQGEAGTLNIRLDLFDDANKSLRSNDAWLLGVGYKKDYTGTEVDEVNRIGGRYSIVASADTSIPGVIYAEGYIGLVLRYLPILIMFLYIIKRLRNRVEVDEWILYGTILALLIAASVNYVQSTIMRRYMDLYPIMLLIQLSILYRKEKCH